MAEVKYRVKLRCIRAFEATVIIEAESFAVARGKAKAMAEQDPQRFDNVMWMKVGSPTMLWATVEGDGAVEALGNQAGRDVLLKEMEGIPKDAPPAIKQGYRTKPATKKATKIITGKQK